MVPLYNGFYPFPLARAVNSNSLIFDRSEFKIDLYMFYYSRYDHINRPFLSWHLGGVPVQGNRKVSLIVTAKTNIPSAINFPGVVSLDDVEYSPGACNVILPGK